MDFMIGFTGTSVLRMKQVDRNGVRSKESCNTEVLPSV